MEKDLKSKTVAGVSWKFAERICAQGVSLIVSIILARILMPSDYAVVSIVTIFFTFANIFISGGFNTSLVQKKDSDLLDYSSVLHLSLLVAGILYIIIFFVAPAIANLYQKDILVSVLRVMGLTFFINAVKSVVCAYISNRMEFKKFFFATIIGTVISAVIGIWMAKAGYGAWALVAQQMINSFIDTVILFISTKFRILFKISFPRVKILFKYGWKVFVTSIISVIYDEVNPLIIGIKFSSNDLSYYTKGRSFPNLLYSTIGDTLASVLLPAMSKVQDDKEAVLRFLRRFMQISSYMVFPMLVGFLAVSDNFIRVLLTDKWMPAAYFIKIFCLSNMFQIITTGNLKAIYAIGRSDLTLIMEIIKKSLYAAVLVIFVLLSGSPEIMAISNIIVALIAITVNSFPNRKILNYKYRLQFIDLLPNFLIASAMGGVVYLINYINMNMYLMLIVQIIVGIAVYVFLSWITRNKNFLYICNSIRAKIKNKKNKENKNEAKN